MSRLADVFEVLQSLKDEGTIVEYAIAGAMADPGRGLPQSLQPLLEPPRQDIPVARRVLRQRWYLVGQAGFRVEQGVAAGGDHFQRDILVPASVDDAADPLFAFRRWHTEVLAAQEPEDGAADLGEDD